VGDAIASITRSMQFTAAQRTRQTTALIMADRADSTFILYNDDLKSKLKLWEELLLQTVSLVPRPNGPMAILKHTPTSFTP
jgi:hypothetical protein